MIAKIDNTKSELCDTCNVKESISHYLYDCKIYEEDRKVLEKDVERKQAAYGLQHIPDINIKLMTGNSVEAARAANLELRNALQASSHGQGDSQDKSKIFKNIYNLLEGLLQSESTLRKQKVLKSRYNTAHSVPWQCRIGFLNQQQKQQQRYRKICRLLQS